MFSDSFLSPVLSFSFSNAFNEGGTGGDSGEKEAAKRQCLEAMFRGDRIRLYMGLLSGRCGARSFGHSDSAVD